MNRDKLDAANCQGGNMPAIQHAAQLIIQISTHKYTSYMVHKKMLLLTSPHVRVTQ